MMIPSIGRIVHYKLSESDAEQIRHNRIHGNPVEAGQVYPAMIVRTWGQTADSAVQLKVELDGPDSFWATSRMQCDAAENEPHKEERWFAPPRVG